MINPLLNWVVAPQQLSDTELLDRIHKAIPAKEHEYLQELRRNADDWKFTIGDTANRWYQMTVDAQLPAALIDVCNQIAHELDDEHLGAASIESFAMLAAFYDDQEVREQCSSLPISHLRYAMSFGDNYAKVIDRDFELAAKNGNHRVSLKVLIADVEQHLKKKVAPSAAGAGDPPDYLIPLLDLTVTIAHIRTHSDALKFEMKQLKRNAPRQARMIDKILQSIDDMLKELDAMI